MCGQSRYKDRYSEQADFFNRGPIDKKEWREFKRYKRRQESPEAKFYKHLTWYIAIMGFFLYKNHGNLFGFFPIAFFWGIGVAMHYFSVFGWPNEQKSNQQEQEDDMEDEPDDKGPNWSDKDLV
ncbi:MAG: 2TM domain-containing protein [Saprospiraceae bacterium]|nr:2TM domain-containing protein [Saprospiraceae bacterium]